MEEASPLRRETAGCILNKPYRLIPSDQNSVECFDRLSEYENEPMRDECIQGVQKDPVPQV